ncbi:hypothetical protein BD779DRAFT_1610817 [Infundibulicybe gibba]|nr:hypothetical protein BD779DRAFT_1610817 [Infundibulicybe gibba]
MIVQTKSAPSKKQKPHRHWISILIVGLLVFSVFAVEAFLRPVRFSGWANSLSGDPLASNRPFSWDNVKPSLVLTWQNCYKSKSRQFECARLIVPRDYSNLQGATIAIALVRLPSSVHVESSEYRGPVLINPGGPGGSGVDFVVGSGESISHILGPQFDVVGFDPRGVGYSTPGIPSFFQTPADRALWGGIMGAVGKGADGLARVWARAQILGKLASDNDRDILAHINTENTARDMLRIVQAHKREKLQYWGFSYDKIERLVVDGVADAENYYSTLWDNNLLDTDKALQTFFDGCHQAGPKLCPFYEPTPDQISRKLDYLFETVSVQPVPAYTQSQYGLMDYARLRLTVFNSLYRPYQTFPLLANGLAKLISGDATALYGLSEGSRFSCSCNKNEPFVRVFDEAHVAILCGDGQTVPRDFKSAEKFYKKFSDASRGWPDVPKSYFRGPFEAKTCFPLLLIGNTAAKKMSKGFPGSVVLTQDSPGHSSISCPSTCTQKYVRGYFVDGTLPPVDKICPVTRGPFERQRLQDQDGPEGQTLFNSSEVISPEDRELLDAIERIHSFLPLPMTHIQN